MYASLTAETMEIFKKSLGLGKQDTLRKGVTISTGLTWYDLQAPAKQLYPIITPLRNAIPRVSRAGHAGGATNWKQITALVGSGYDGMGWVPEGQRSGTMSYVTANKSATYVTLGEEDFLTFEAEAAAEGFEDENAKVTFRLLQKMMRKEESGLLAGNSGGVQLGTPGTISTSSSGTGSTLPTATYFIKVAALTQEGYNNCAGSAANGVPVSRTITGADGKQFTLNGGSSAISAEVSQAVTLGAPLLASVPAIQGAVAYAWFISTATTTETLQQITTINSMAQSTPLATGRQAQTALSATDCSSNPNYAFDGLMTQALNSSNLGYVNVLATGTAGVGTFLTTSGKGTVNEIDAMLQQMWQSYKIGPTVIYVNAQEQKNITAKVLNGASAPLLRYTSASDGKEYSLTAGGYIEYYYNPFDSNGGYKIPIRIHPDLAPGTIVAYAEKLPEWYQSNDVPNVAEVITRRDYYRMDWPLRTRQREYGVYAEEVLAVYATFGLGIITNIGNG